MADFCWRALAYITGQPLTALRKKKQPELGERLLRELRARPWLLVLDGSNVFWLPTTATTPPSFATSRLVILTRSHTVTLRPPSVQRTTSCCASSLPRLSPKS